MKRRLLNFCTALSLLLCVAVVALWVRSYFEGGRVGWSRSAGGPWSEVYISSEWDFVLGRGRIVVERTRRNEWWRRIVRDNSGAWHPTDPGMGPWEWVARWEGPQDYVGAIPDVPGTFDRAGFGYYRVSLGGYESWIVAAPAWLPAVLFALLPGARLLRRLRRRAAPGSCRQCGYDLRATPVRCPECGAAAAVTG